MYLLPTLVVKISGATYPGVPHLGNKYLGCYYMIEYLSKVSIVANPKSTRTKV